jgi:hypothetical protein
MIFGFMLPGKVSTRSQTVASDKIARMVHGVKRDVVMDEMFRKASETKTANNRHWGFEQTLLVFCCHVADQR